MLRPQKGNFEVSFNDTLLNFGLCSMETVQQNGRFTLFSSKFLSIYSILYGTAYTIINANSEPIRSLNLH